MSGYVQGVDTRSQIIALQQPNGQPVNLLFDNQTKVIYNNQSYAVTSLDRGDQVTARVQNTEQRLLHGRRAGRSAGPGLCGATTTSGNVQTVQGTVRQIDQQNGLFTMDVSNGTRLTVSMPYSPSRTDVTKFQSSALGGQRADRGGVSEQLAGGAEAVLLSAVDGSRLTVNGRPRDAWVPGVGRKPSTD